MTKKVLFLGVALLLVLNRQGRPAPSPQDASRGLVGTWTLVSMQQRVDSNQPVTVADARGLIVFDSAGHAIEVITRLTAQPLPGLTEVRSRLSLGGFWGGYRADTTTMKITYKASGAVSPNVMGVEFARFFDLAADRLTVTSLPGELHMNGVTRWVWERVPTVAQFGESYRQVVGFWQHVSETRVHATSGAVFSETKRAPSVIVYTPSGFVAVHFPTAGRPRFASAEPTEAEERSFGTHLGYYGALGVYPGAVFHNVLGTVSPGNLAGGSGVVMGNILKRFFELKDGELRIRFPQTINQDGQPQTTIVVLKRLSGEKEMLGK